jgi:hypothetical protein
MRRNLEGTAKGGFFEIPRQVGQVRAPADHQAGQVETGRGGMTAGFRQKRLDDRLQPFVVAAAELLLRDEFARPLLGRNECQPRCGATDIAGDQHQAGSFQNCRRRL